MSFKAIKEKYATELEATNELIRQNLDSDCPQSEDLIRTIEQSRGKQLRPLLAYSICRSNPEAYKKVSQLAAVFESIHIASLVHDDVIDKCDVRRDMPTMNALYNDGVAVLLGDILFVNVYKLCVPLGDITLVDEVSDTISTLVEGELLQQSNSFDLDVKEETYLEIIRRKTSALLALCCRASIRMCGHGEEVMKAGEDFANAFGRMFQIADDWADFYKANEKDNKDRGVDIANGFITLPWIYLKASVQGEEGEVLNKILASKEPAGYDNPEIRELCSKYDIKGKMMLRMKSLYDDANQALDTLDQSFDSSELRIFLKTLYKKITLENHG